MRRALVLAVACLLLPLWAGSPAQAAQGRITDPRDPALPGEMDLLRVVIKNGEQRVAVRVEFRNIRRDRRARTKVLVDPRPSDDQQYLVSWVHRPSKGTRARLEIATDQEFGGDPIPCAGLVAGWNFKTDVVRVSVPHDCFAEDARTYRFKAVAGFWTPGGLGDYTRFLNVRRG
jgi:hypothetical protein